MFSLERTEPSAQPRVKPICAFFLSIRTWEFFGLAAVSLTLFGTWLWWHLQTHRSDVEEAAKDGEITAEQAHGKIRMIEVRAVTCICAGIVLMLVSAIKLLE